MAPSGDRPTVLLVEDERSLAEPVQRGLQEEGYAVDVAADGRDGLMRALAEDYDVLIVDWRLPRLDGRTLIERLRGANRRMPILMLTARRDVGDRVAGLDAGADDYLTKPFSFEELLARLRALHRRADAYDRSTDALRADLVAGPLRMDVARRTAWLGEQELELRTKEFRLLELLIRRSDEVVTRTVIAERVWGSAFDVTDNAIDVTVSTLRSRLNGSTDPGGAVRIETVRGVGYRLVADHGSEE
ncbi:MAG: response regulator transcription factor [Rhodothermales bacterium]